MYPKMRWKFEQRNEVDSGRWVQSHKILRKKNGKEIEAERWICERAKVCVPCRHVRVNWVIRYGWDIGCWKAAGRSGDEKEGEVSIITDSVCQTERSGSSHAPQGAQMNCLPLLYILVLRHGLSNNPFGPREYTISSLLVWWDSDNFIVSLENYSLQPEWSS